MIDDPTCPVCGDRDWTVVGARTYVPEKVARWNKSAARVLFDLWRNGEKAFRAEFTGCGTCAMMIYRPRPTPADIDAKYAGAAKNKDFNPTKFERSKRLERRSTRLHQILRPHLKKPIRECRILDFGGGDGRLLAKFVEEGATCELIDFCSTPIAGVTRVGSTEQDLREDSRYDAIVCSHVVEHLADPLGVLKKLSDVLDPQGMIYVEVPVEVRKNMPAGREPVTHINFFIPESLRALMERAGYVVDRCGLTAYPHPRGGWTLCTGALASRGNAETLESAGMAALRHYLNPSATHLLRVNAILWRGFPRRLATKLAMTARSLVS